MAASESEGSAASASARARASDRFGKTEAAAFCLFVIGVAWVPFWNGSNELAAWGINAVLFAGIAALCEVAVLVRGGGGRHSFGLRNIGLPAILFALALAWIYAQTIAWMDSPLANPIWGMAAKVLDKPLAGAISVNRDLTNLALLRLLTAVLVFWTALQLCRNGALANLLLKSITAIGCGYAAYGLLALNLPAVRVPWMLDTEGLVSSTFVNRNSFAAYAGLGLVVACGLTAQLYRKEVARAGTRRLAIAAGIEAAGRKGAPLIVAGFLIVAALLLTGSRGGVGATGLGLFVLAVLTRKPGEPGEHHRTLPPAVLIVLGFVTVAGLLFMFGDPFVASLRERGLADTSRASVYWLTVQSIIDRPILGHGYGTFVDVFPMYRDRSISADGLWEQAHDTYLEVFQGLGLAFGAMLLTSVLLLVWRCVKGAATRRENATVPRIAVAAAVLVGVHSLVDFSLQIQAVAITFAALLGAGVAQAQSRRLDLQD